VRAHTNLLPKEPNMPTTARTIDRTDLPAPGRWAIDPGHAEVGFVGRHFGLTKIRGRFTGISGVVVIDDDRSASSVDVAIEMASVSSGDATRDDHLRSADFFDVERHPTAAFRSTAVTADGPSGTLTGALTIKGVTRPVTLDVDYLGHAHDPWGNERSVFSAAGTIDREDWGLTWNMLLDTGGLLVSREIRLEIELELIRQTTTEAAST
jgi:polyisoprenoid-binding protein YceI